MNLVLIRLLCAVGCGLAATAAVAAEPVWFAVAGDPRDPAADTILIDMSSLRARQNLQVMEVRVSRGQERLSRNTGHRFRSYAAKVHIDCARDQALIRTTRFYSTPLWSGQPFATAEFPDPQQVPFALRDFDPNPMPRIMRAACNPI